MRAVVYRGDGKINFTDIPRPRPGPGEALLRVIACGICGTDLRILKSGHHRIPTGTPRVLGHELAGEIVEVGEGVDLTIGTRVGVAPNIGCGTCIQCVSEWPNLCADYDAFGVSLDGGFAEYMLITTEAIQQGNVVVVPDHVLPQETALAEPLSCCLNGQEAVSVGVGDIVLIVGAGPIGVMHVMLARLSGARMILVSELTEARLKEAEIHGADVIINPEKDDLLTAVRDLTHGHGVDVVIVAASSRKAQEQALELVASRGRINLFGGLQRGDSMVSLDANLIHYKQLVITGTTGSNVRQYRSAINLIASKRILIEDLISGRLPLDQFDEGIRRSQSVREMRIVLEP